VTGVTKSNTRAKTRNGAFPTLNSAGYLKPNTPCRCACCSTPESAYHTSKSVRRGVHQRFCSHLRSWARYSYPARSPSKDGGCMFSWGLAPRIDLMPLSSPISWLPAAPTPRNNLSSKWRVHSSGRAYPSQLSVDHRRHQV